MRGSKSLAFALIAAIVFLGVGAANAAQIPWKTPSGTTNDFTFDNGGTSDQLFVPAGTDPVVTPGGIAFFPSAFKAQASGGAQQQVSDKLSFDLHAKPGKELTNFVVNEFGDYSIQGIGPNTAVKVFGSLFLTNLDTFEVKFDTLHTTPAAIGVGKGVVAGEGAWTGNEAISLPSSVVVPPGWRNVRVELDNVLQVSSDPGTNAFIEKKVITPGVTITLIAPEPASAALCLMASALFLGRRRNAVA